MFTESTEARTQELAAPVSVVCIETQEGDKQTTLVRSGGLRDERADTAMSTLLI